MNEYPYTPDNFDNEREKQFDDIQRPSLNDVSPRASQSSRPREAQSSQKTVREKSVKTAPKRSAIVRSKKNRSGLVGKLSDKRVRGVLGIALILFALYVIIAGFSFIRNGISDQAKVVNGTIAEMTHNAATGEAPVANVAGPVGASVSHAIFVEGFGIGAIIIIAYLILLGLGCLGLRRTNFWSLTFKTLIDTITLSLVAGLITYPAEFPFPVGGYHGRYVNQWLIEHVGVIGDILINILLVAIVVFIYINELRLLIKKYNELKRRRRAMQEARRQAELERQRQVDENLDKNVMGKNDTAPSHSDTPGNRPLDIAETPVLVEFESDTRQPAESLTDTTAGDMYKTEQQQSVVAVDDTFEVTTNVIEQTGDDTVVADQDQYDPTADLSHYVFPSLDLLAEPKDLSDNVNYEEQEENKARITKTLADYGIPIQRIRATVGPTVTLFEIVPSEGVRIAKIKRLEDDIALSLSALGIRIIAPIPGKGTIGIEVPNKKARVVSIRTVLGSPAFRDTKYALPIALGATISNEVFIADLAKMPHLLVAGATGQGKSVGLNTMIASLLYKMHPSRLKFVLIDPKSVEFSLYNMLQKHYLAQLPDDEEAVITNFDKVERTLNSLCVEMDNRYALLKDAGVRQLSEYNEKFVERRLNPEKGHRYLPYIVIIIDEFADLFMMSGKKIEMPIARIAQKARAVGMHVIIATQRPSANVITGIIKANFPARIAFRVSQAIDSKTILDRMGANQLIGRGDMLISNNGTLDRVQCALIETDEVMEICRHINSQAGFEHPYYLPEPMMGDGDPGSSSSFDNGALDPLFPDVARYFVSTGTASTSTIQRRYSIGYNRAGKITDQLEARGIIGPASGSKPRAVLVDPATLEQILSTLGI